MSVDKAYVFPLKLLLNYQLKDCDYNTYVKYATIS